MVVLTVFSFILEESKHQISFNQDNFRLSISVDWLLIAYLLLARFSVTRLIAYLLLARFSVTRLLAYLLLARFSVTRLLAYLLLARFSVTRLLAYLLLNRFSVARLLAYLLLARFSVTGLQVPRVVRLLQHRDVDGAVDERQRREVHARLRAQQVQRQAQQLA